MTLRPAILAHSDAPSGRPRRTRDRPCDVHLDGSCEPFDDHREEALLWARTRPARGPTFDEHHALQEQAYKNL